MLLPPTAVDGVEIVPSIIRYTSLDQDRQILLISHQMIRANESNLKRYNSYKRAARDLLIYDESLLTSDVNNFTVRALCAALDSCHRTA